MTELFDFRPDVDLRCQVCEAPAQIYSSHGGAIVDYLCEEHATVHAGISFIHRVTVEAVLAGGNVRVLIEPNAPRERIALSLRILANWIDENGILDPKKYGDGLPF